MPKTLYLVLCMGFKWKSVLSADHLLEVQLALCCNNRQLVCQVVVDQVADALEKHVFSPNLIKKIKLKIKVTDSKENN